MRGWGPTLVGYSIQVPPHCKHSWWDWPLRPRLSQTPWRAGRRQVWALRILQEVRPAPAEPWAGQPCLEAAEPSAPGRYYADLAGEEMFHNNKTLIYLAGAWCCCSRGTCLLQAPQKPHACCGAGSASAEFFADIGLCPLEAVKVKVQTNPGAPANVPPAGLQPP